MEGCYESPRNIYFGLELPPYQAALCARKLRTWRISWFVGFELRVQRSTSQIFNLSASDVISSRVS